MAQNPQRRDPVSRCPIHPLAGLHFEGKARFVSRVSHQQNEPWKRLCWLRAHLRQNQCLANEDVQPMRSMVMTPNQRNRVLLQLGRNLNFPRLATSLRSSGVMQPRRNCVLNSLMKWTHFYWLVVI